MLQRQLTAQGPSVSAIGLGCMGMSDLYGAADRRESLATLLAATERGVTLLDTGDLYGMGHNELLLRELLRHRRREDLFIAVKFGPQRAPDGEFLGIDCRPAATKNALAHTLTRLGTDYVDLYQPARVDPNVPIEETVGAIEEMRRAGHVRHIGLSEAAADTVRRAHAQAPVSWLQIEYSLLSRGIESEILPACRELGIALNAYGVLSRGLLSGHWTANRERAPEDFRNRLPRFQGRNLDNNLALVQALRQRAGAIGVTVAQLAIAWVMAQGEDIIPLVGARNRERLDEALGALDVALPDAEFAAIESAVPAHAVAGQRYDPGQMAMLDSERGG
ncbi:aldo/keto reductase [Arhodomonas sp. AD133]|uniref:aldo/keto reductase n=1 Tax=Arhodomonas sp. AD133 TaxID=3415009 RepID=UPI003EBB31C6